ncbi:MAG: trimeric intracellular cation channel family protein [Bacillota bacterium]|nr:trimeric intracellular cation channel family protein [Bacillota bacterium]
MNIDFVFALEIIGTIVFAISGASVAIQEKMDLLGVCILGMTTAVGGGTIRDLVLGITPPAAFQHPFFALTALVTSLLVFLFARQDVIDLDGWLYTISDSLGLAVFTITGALTGVSSGNPFLIVFVGCITGVGGGVMRDVFANRKPVIFQKHVYATASLAGAVVFAVLSQFNRYSAAAVGGAVIFILRILAYKNKWDLPRAE